MDINFVNETTLLSFPYFYYFLDNFDYMILDQYGNIKLLTNDKDELENFIGKKNK